MIAVRGGKVWDTEETPGNREPGRTGVRVVCELSKTSRTSYLMKSMGRTTERGKSQTLQGHRYQRTAEPECIRTPTESRRIRSVQIQSEEKA